MSEVLKLLIYKVKKEDVEKFKLNLDSIDFNNTDSSLGELVYSEVFDFTGANIEAVNRAIYTWARYVHDNPVEEGYEYIDLRKATVLP